MSTVGSLQVNITASTDNFQKGLQRVARQAKKFRQEIQGLAGIAIGAFGGMFHWFEGIGSELHDLSEATGISVENLDFLKYAAEQSGAGIENLTKASKELISRGINPNRLEEIAGEIAGITDEVQRGQAAMYYFGTRSGLALLPMSRELPELRKRFGELAGSGFTQKMADQANKLGDSWRDVKLALRGVAFTIVDVLRPAILGASEWIANHVGGIREWIKTHPTLIKGIALTAVGLALLVPILYAIEKAAKAAFYAMVLFNIAKAHPYLALALAAGVAGYGAYEALSASSAPAQDKSQNPLSDQQSKFLNGLTGGQSLTAPAPVGSPQSQPPAMMNGGGSQSDGVEGHTKRAADSLESLLTLMRMRNQQDQLPSVADSTNDDPSLAFAGVR